VNPWPCFIADDEDAKKTARVLVHQAQFDPYDLGPLSNARLMEAQAELWIWLAMRGGLGNSVSGWCGDKPKGHMIDLCPMAYLEGSGTRSEAAPIMRT
jgi:hypothetical protein